MNVLSNPFRESTVTILGLIELGGLLSKDGEDSFREITGFEGADAWRGLA